MSADTHSTTLPTVVAPSSETTFYFDGSPLRVFDLAGKPWFAAGDVAKSIGHRDAADVTRILKDVHKGTHLVRTPGGEQSISIISEAGMYRAILMRQAGKKVAAMTVRRIERFQDWVSGEVLPEIRRTGSYAPQAPAFDPNDPVALRGLLLGYSEQLIAARAEVVETRQALVVAETKAAEVAPMVDAYRDLLDDGETCCLSNAARLLDAPQAAFFAWLRKRGFVFETGDSTLPRADLRKDGLFKVRFVRLSKTRHVEQTMVTRAGLVWLRHRWLAKRRVDAAASAKAAKAAGQDLFGNVA